MQQIRKRNQRKNTFLDNRINFSWLIQGCIGKSLQACQEFKHIQTYSGIIEHIQELLTAYSELCVNLAYSKPWYIQKTGISRIRTYSEPGIYSKPGETSTMECFAKIIKSK